MDDWVDSERWEPFIWEQVKANEDGKDLLKLLQLAKGRKPVFDADLSSPGCKSWRNWSLHYYY